MNKQQLASKIWESANKMRSKIEANEYKDYILGFIFYKFLSDKEVKFLKENDFTKEDIEMIRARAEKEIREAERINNKVKENIEKAKHNHKIKLTLNNEETKWGEIKNDYLRGN